MRLYKLTDTENRTANNTQWGENVTHSVKGKLVFCENAIHCYTDPYLAVIFNPIHAGFSEYHLWEAEGKIELNDSNMKYGCRTLTTLQQIEISNITLVQKVAFAILCAKAVYKESAWNLWADNWLADTDRSDTAYAAAYDTAYAAASAARAAVYTQPLINFTQLMHRALTYR